MVIIINTLHNEQTIVERGVLTEPRPYNKTSGSTFSFPSITTLTEERTGKTKCGHSNDFILLDSNVSSLPHWNKFCLTTKRRVFIYV